jgi:PAS domain S-box-containing protein
MSSSNSPVLNPATLEQPDLLEKTASQARMRHNISYDEEARGRNTPAKVLLVDDDQNTYLLIRRMLGKSSAPLQVDWVDTYESGLQAVARNEHDVYLFDYRLGAHTGLELLQEAIGAGCKAPIIMLTSENPEVDAQAMRLGAADFLSKDRLDSSLLERSIRYSIKHFAALRALRESQVLLASFMQNVPCAVFMKDTEGHYLYLNETCEKFFGRNVESCLGKSDEALWPRHMARRLKQTDAEICAGKKVLETTETVTGPDGIHYWLATRFPILNEHNRPIMVGGAAIDITERKRLEEEIQEISEQEKRRIGQDLHDGLGQHLTGIAFMAKALQQRLSTKRLPEASDAANITALVNDTITQTRDLARGLCPVEVERNGLHAALQQLSGSVEKMFGVSCSFNGDQPVLLDDNAAAVHLYRIAQEAINNAIKHGSAKSIEIQLASNNGFITLSVTDNGEGLAGIGQNGDGKGMGLRVMNYRAGMIGATLEISGEPGHGAKVICKMPQKGKLSENPAAPAKPRRSRQAAR